MQVNITNLVDAVQWYQTVRALRWPDGVACPSCQSKHVIKRGFDDTEPARQRSACTDCHTRFDARTDIGCPNRLSSVDRFLYSRCLIVTDSVDVMSRY